MHGHSHSDHDHHSHDGHSHGGGVAYGRAFIIGIVLNTVFIVAEVVAGLISNSTALLADAGHNFGDVIGLLVAGVAAWLSTRPPTERYTYGFGSTSILAAQINAVLLLVAVGAIVVEAIDRFYNPQPVATTIVMIVAAIGILINGATAALFASGREGDLNIKGAFLHMVSDAAVSLGVVIGAALIALTGWLWIDPVISLLIAVIIVWSTWGLMRDSMKMSLGAVPSNVVPADVRAYLASLPGVASLHDLHVWSLSTTQTALTCHLVMPQGHPGDPFLRGVADELDKRFAISHATVQVECSEDLSCSLAPDHIV